MFYPGYNWLDQAMIYFFQKGHIRAVTWHNLGDVWRQCKGVAHIAIVRRDGKVIYRRGW